jgi:hypothetical protein
MRSVVESSRRQLAAICVLIGVLATAGCTADLAPPYDPQIEHNLVEAEEQTQVFFERVLLGGDKATYEANETFYVDTLGKLHSVETLTKTRPQPQGFLADLGGKAVKSIEELKAATKKAAGKLPNFSAEIVTRIIANVRDMREEHKSKGATGFTESDVKFWRPLIGQNYADALLYERYLKD